jgi:hypothetical protein
VQATPSPTKPTKYDMTTLAKWVWFAMLIIFFIGGDIVWYAAIAIISFVVILWLKPEWLDKL